MEQDSRPRARTVFEAVREQQGVTPDEQAEPSAVVEKPAHPRWELVKSAANRELDRFAALTGVLTAHLTTSVVLTPVLLVSLKAVVTAALFGTGSLAQFTWLQALALTGGIWIAGPLGFFLYRYWSGKF